MGFYKLLLIIFTLSFVSCVNRAEPELHIFNKGFQGYVIIIFNDFSGQEVKYKDGFRVYEIPSNGILRTKFKAQTGWIPNNKLKYCFDSNGECKLIEYRDFNNDNLDTNSICVHHKELSKGLIRYIVSPLNKTNFYYSSMRDKINELFPPTVQ
ncbi:MAG: hypothetical protein IPP06_03230 [Saprospiraceae bacterium]|nr:hypothetical protein [Candidatus Vicinibacter affinis]